MNAPRHITAENVLLCLVARKANARCRWAAMSNSAISSECREPRWWRTPYRMPPHPSLLLPMNSGQLDAVVERTRLQPNGLKAVRTTWGKGYRAMQAETKSCTMRLAGKQP